MQRAIAAHKARNGVFASSRSPLWHPPDRFAQEVFRLRRIFPAKVSEPDPEDLEPMEEDRPVSVPERRVGRLYKAVLVQVEEIACVALDGLFLVLELGA